MEINRIILEKKEFEIVNSILQSFNNKVQWQKVSDGSFLLSISDEDAEVLSQTIQEKYVLEGFDLYYNLNHEGEKYQKLIDKFWEIGW
ncbi:hypothetical protein ACFSKL_01170 [Belliella marina]|uniref:Uncharacterized protein n=1 Tax=Belliella marina TaxID=1644146 RepID=A0ABW4VHV7_9BACT